MERYFKILVAKNSPENKCFANDGEILVVATDKDKMKGKLPKEHHFFVGIETRTPSRYGWVKEIKEGITALEIAKKNYYGLNKIEIKEADISKEDIEEFEKILSIVAKEKEGTPMAATYWERGIFKNEKKLVLKVHKIKFFEA
ncbi:MAG: hypothetical protein AB1414_15635 [bacterium]